MLTIPRFRAALAATATLVAAGLSAPATLADVSSARSNKQVVFRVLEFEYQLTEELRSRRADDLVTRTADVRRKTFIRHRGRRGDGAAWAYARPARYSSGTIQTRQVSATTTQTGNWSNVFRDGETEGGSCDGQRTYRPGKIAILLEYRRGRAVGELRPFIPRSGNGCAGNVPNLYADVKAKIRVPARAFRSRHFAVPFIVRKTRTEGGETQSLVFQGSIMLLRKASCPPRRASVCQTFR
jgi:hypothetical protein